MIDKFFRFRIGGDHLGKIMTLVLNNNEFDKACSIMDMLDKGQHSILGVPKFETLSQFVDQCIERRTPMRAIVSNFQMKLLVSCNPFFFRCASNIVSIADLPNQMF